MAWNQYFCVNEAFDPEGIKIYQGVDDFLQHLRDQGIPEPELWVKTRSVLTRPQGDQSPFGWTLTLVKMDEPKTLDEVAASKGSTKVGGF